MKRGSLPIWLLLFAVAAAGQTPARLPDFDRRTPVVLAVENVGPAVVNIRVQSQVRVPHFYRGLFQVPAEEDPATGRMYTDSSLGSGVVVHPDGFAVTNEHVIHGADRVIVKLQDGREVSATTINASIDSDVALLKLDGDGPYPAAVLGDSSQLMVGETTIALGNPFGLSSSATTGILSAVGRSVRFQGRNVYEDFLQTSALINPGNSGGPLLDINGRVIGINVAIDSRGQGIGFAIPINRVKEVMTDLLDPEIVKMASIGVAPEMKQGRLFVRSVVEDGPAARSGIAGGDALIAVDGRPVTTPFEFHAALLRHAPNEAVAVDVEHGGIRTRHSLVFEPISPGALLRNVPTVSVLGMECAQVTPAIATRLRLPNGAAGVVVVDVDPDGTAASLGLKPRDIVLQLGNSNIRNLDQLQSALRVARRYRSAPIQIFRDGEGVMQGRVNF